MDKQISILVSARNEENCKCIIDNISNQDDLKIIGIENDETGTLIKTERLKPDLLILDIQPPGIDGCELAPIIHRRSPSTSIIMMSDRDDNDYASTVLKAGISGFLLKKTDINKLFHVIKIVNMGGYYFSASIIRRAMKTFLFLNQFPEQIINKVIEIKKEYTGKAYNNFFSSAERGIIRYMAKGLSDNDIAKQLNYSVGAVRNILTAIKRKTNLKNRIQIAIFSFVYEIIEIEFS